MEAGHFNNMNEAFSKFIGSCTETTGQQNTIYTSVNDHLIIDSKEIGDSKEEISSLETKTGQIIITITVLEITIMKITTDQCNNRNISNNVRITQSDEISLENKSLPLGYIASTLTLVFLFQLKMADSNRNVTLLVDTGADISLLKLNKSTFQSWQSSFDRYNPL